jgi:quercetin dioxygenase-like cupin family protein
VPAGEVRLVVTGHGPEGLGRVVSDEKIPPRSGLAADGWQAYMLWGTDALPTYPDSGESAYETTMPPPGAVRFVELVVYPEGKSIGAEGDAAELSASGIEREPGDTSGMHHTPTFDLVVVLEGEVVLELDQESTVLSRGDYLVQSGTRHAWRNLTESPARLGVIVVGTHHAGFPGE